MNNIEWGSNGRSFFLNIDEKSKLDSRIGEERKTHSIKGGILNTNHPVLFFPKMDGCGWMEANLYTNDARVT